MTGEKYWIRIGAKFSHITVITEVEPFRQPDGQTQRGFLCRCVCGKEKKIRLSHLIHNRVKSCGCHGTTHTPHGLADHPLHSVWRGMRGRCNRPTSNRYHVYGGRGISVCESWNNSFLSFYEWAIKNKWEGGLTIDRINNDGNYEPGNCRFVPFSINANNTSNTYYVNYEGRKIAFMLLLRDKNLLFHSSTIRGRIKRGWNIEDAINKPIRKGNYGKK